MQNCSAAAKLYAPKNSLLPAEGLERSITCSAGMLTQVLDIWNLACSANGVPKATHS